MEPVTLQAEVRETRGKGPARQLRMRGLLPVVFYGPGVEPLPLQLDPEPLRRLLDGEYGRNQLLELDLAGDKRLALVKDLAVHPVSRRLLHVDFYAASRERPTKGAVPLETRGRAIGVQKGGLLSKLFRELPVRALPQDIPAAVVVDVARLDIGQVVTVADLELPEGVEVTLPPTRRLVVVEAKSSRAEKAEKGAGEEGEAAAEA